MLSKEELRSHIKAEKAKYPEASLKLHSEVLFTKIEYDPAFIDAKRILLYWSLPDEVSSHRFINKWIAHKDIYLPTVCGQELILTAFEDEKSLSFQNNYKIGEAKGKILKEMDSIEYAIIPGIAFDYKGNRMGRGKGFYDRLLPNLSCKKVGVCFPFQYFDQIPVEAHDIRMNQIFF